MTTLKNKSQSFFSHDTADVIASRAKKKLGIDAWVVRSPHIGLYGGWGGDFDFYVHFSTPLTREQIASLHGPQHSPLT